jgi:biotin transport system substrate-specific component
MLDCLRNSPYKLTRQQQDNHTMNISLDQTSDQTPDQTLANTLWPAKSNTMLRNIILAVAGSLLLWVSAKIQIPFYPVPMTMQTFVVLGLGAAFGWRLAMMTMLLYIAEGAVGLPVFAGNPAVTGGYLAGFVAASGLIGWLAQRGADKNAFKMFAAMLAGSAVIYIFGAAWLSTLIGLEKAILGGVLPFLYGDLLKAALAAALFPAVWKFLKKN